MDLRPEEILLLSSSGRCVGCGHLTVLHYENPCCSYAGCHVPGCPCDRDGLSAEDLARLEAEAVERRRTNVPPPPPPPWNPGAGPVGAQGRAGPMTPLEARAAEAFAQPFVGRAATPETGALLEAVQRNAGASRVSLVQNMPDGALVIFDKEPEDLP